MTTPETTRDEVLQEFTESWDGIEVLSTKCMADEIARLRQLLSNSCTLAPVPPVVAEDAERDYGYCPVQIEGRTSDDRAWYFRARGRHFELNLGAVGDTSEFAAMFGTPMLEGEIHSDFSAGWMPHDLAKALTDWAIRVYENDFTAALRPDTRGES